MFQLGFLNTPQVPTPRGRRAEEREQVHIQTFHFLVSFALRLIIFNSFFNLCLYKIDLFLQKYNLFLLLVFMVGL